MHKELKVKQMLYEQTPYILQGQSTMVFQQITSNASTYITHPHWSNSIIATIHKVSQHQRTEGPSVMKE